VGSGRIKRPPRRKPDKALYVPKAMRKKVEWGEQEVGADGAREGEICPKAALEGEAEGGPGPNGAIGGVCLVLDEQHKDGEESGKSSHGTNGDRPPRCTDVPPLESSDSSSGQHSQDKDCSDSLSSVPNENPAEPEEQSKSCDDTVGPEGSKTPCQDQKSRDADSKSSHLLGEHCSDATLVLENPKKSCAMSLESSGNVSVQGEDVVSPVLELGEGPSAPESEDQESFSSAREEPTQQQTPLEARGEAVLAPEPIGGAGPSGRSEQEEHREDVPVAKDGVREPMGLADALQRELRLPKGDQEENAATQSRELAFEDDCTAELLQEVMHAMALPLGCFGVKRAFRGCPPPGGTLVLRSVGVYSTCWTLLGLEGPRWDPAGWLLAMKSHLMGALHELSVHYLQRCLYLGVALSHGAQHWEHL